MHPSTLPNLILRGLKWPVGVIALLMLPATPEMLEHPALTRLLEGSYEGILHGAALYLGAWVLVFRRALAGSYFSTFEHELTHALFAWMTLHRVTGLRVTWDQGGAMTYEGSGGGNWLISLGPYWFPTLCVIPLAFLPFVKGEELYWVHVLLGFCALYHITSTWRETHPRQTDLHEAGWLFSAMFLPSANLLSYTSLVVLATAGPGATARFIYEWLSRSYAWLISL